MTEEFRLEQMKRAIRDAMPAGAGDFTVTSIARAALNVAERWLAQAEADAALDVRDALERRDC